MAFEDLLVCVVRQKTSGVYFWLTLEFEQERTGFLHLHSKVTSYLCRV